MRYFNEEGQDNSNDEIFHFFNVILHPRLTVAKRNSSDSLFFYFFRETIAFISKIYYHYFVDTAVFTEAGCKRGCFCLGHTSCEFGIRLRANAVQL